jgi:hypothetical protein
MSWEINAVNETVGNQINKNVSKLKNYRNKSC